MIEKPKMNYSFLSLLDMIKNPQAIYDYVESRKIRCAKCKCKISIRFLEDCITVVHKDEVDRETGIVTKKGCGATILYPPREDRGDYYLLVPVSRRERESRKEENR